MLKPLLLRLHRWITLVFALPLLAIMVTGLILSFEPLASSGGTRAGVVTAQRLAEWMAKYDPGQQVRALTIRHYENTLALSGVGTDGETEIDIRTGIETDEDGGWMSDLFSQSRGLHERLIYDLGWLVTASSFAMLALATLGILMGWPRLRNTLGGWHKLTAWVFLPLLILSPLTGLFLAYRVTFTTPPSTPPVAIKIREAVAVLGATHDLSGLTSVRVRGGRMVARIWEGGELRSFVITPAGATQAQRNWPRLIHEGNWAGSWSAALNILTALVMIGLLCTGLWIYLRRRLRLMARKRETTQGALPAE
jgi:uncharacterized iron-regulated membrane protein